MTTSVSSPAVVHDELSTQAVVTSRRFRTLPVAALCLAAFGPYLSESIGVRTEQPAFFVVAVALLPMTVRRAVPLRMAAALTLLSTVLVVAVVGLLVPVDLASSGFERGSAIAGVVNNAMPLLGILAAAGLVAAGYSPAEIFRTFSRVVVTTMAINSLIEFVQVRAHLDPILRHFWTAASAADVQQSVAFRALGNGRQTGIFNQPAQAGFLYGLAVLLAMYLWGRLERRPARLVAVVSLLIVGGTFTVSKIFLFVALPLLALVVVRPARRRFTRLSTVGTVLVLAVVVQQAIGFSFPGAAQLSQYFHGGSGVVSLYSAGRFGSGGTLLPVFKTVLRSSALAGFGAAGTTTPVDSDWLNVMVTAGLIGIACYVGLLVTLASGYKPRLYPRNSEDVALAILLLTALSGFGFPVLTGNRISGVLWVLLTLLFLTGVPLLGGRDTAEPLEPRH